MKILISTLLVFFYLMVNVLALSEQKKHDPSVNWPTKEWSINTDNFVGNSNFENKVKELFSNESFSKYGKTNSLLIIQNGEIIFEKYNTGIKSDTKLVSWSMAKSYTAAITGIMIDKGFISSIHENNLIPSWNDLRKEITVDHLLNMKPGLEFVEEYNIEGRSDTAEMLFDEGMLDQGKYATNSPLIKLPGTSFNYSTGTTNILSYILKNKLNKKEIDYYNFIDQNLLEPIGLNNTTLEFDKSGTFIGGSSVYASTRDYAKFGYLYLRNGTWNGEQVISKDWIDKTRTPSKHTYNSYSNKFWHVNKYWKNAYNFPKDTYYCAGFGGQYILIIPSKDLIVVRLGETYNTSTDQLLSFLGEIVSEVPAK